MENHFGEIIIILEKFNVSYEKKSIQTEPVIVIFVDYAMDTKHIILILNVHHGNGVIFTIHRQVLKILYKLF